MSSTPNAPDAPPTLAARIREILHGPSRYALAGGAALLVIVIVAGAMSRHTRTPRTPRVAAAPAPAQPKATAVHPMAPPVSRHVAPAVAVAGAPPASPADAPATRVAAPAKPSAASTVAVTQTPAQPAGLVSPAMPKPSKLTAGDALETMYDLSSAGGWVQTTSALVPLPRSSFVARASTQGTRVTWDAWCDVAAPTRVLTLVLAKGTDGDLTVDVDGVRVFRVKRGAFSLAARATLVSPLSLAPGWHELSVDYSRKWGWQHSAQVTIAAGNGVTAPALLDLSAAPVSAAPTSAPTGAPKPVETKP